MESYQSMLTKITALQQKASALRNAEKTHAIAEMRKLIALYDIQPAELFAKIPATRKAPVIQRATAVQPLLYRDPASGKTWSGRGKRPGWLIGDKLDYLVDGTTALQTKKRNKTTQSKPLQASGTRKKTTIKTASVAAKPEKTKIAKKNKPVKPASVSAKRKPRARTRTPKEMISEVIDTAISGTNAA